MAGQLNYRCWWRSSEFFSFWTFDRPRISLLGSTWTHQRLWILKLFRTWTDVRISWAIAHCSHVFRCTSFITLHLNSLTRRSLFFYAWDPWLLMGMVLGWVCSVRLFRLREHPCWGLPFSTCLHHWVTFIASKNFLHYLSLILVIYWPLRDFAPCLRIVQFFPQSRLLTSWADRNPWLAQILLFLFFGCLFLLKVVPVLNYWWPPSSSFEGKCSVHVSTWRHRRLFNEPCQQGRLIRLSSIRKSSLITALSVNSFSRPVGQHRWLIVDGAAESTLLHLGSEWRVSWLCLPLYWFADQQDVLLELVLGADTAF